MHLEVLGRLRTSNYDPIHVFLWEAHDNSMRKEEEIIDIIQYLCKIYV